MAFILFVGSVYLMLSLVFGKWMGYLVLAVCFSGWLIIHSSLWFFGFWAQGPGTPTNQGPRGQEPVLGRAGGRPQRRRVSSSRRSRSIRAMGGQPPNAGQLSSIQSVSSAATTFLAAAGERGTGPIDPLATDAIQGTQFTIDSVKFATAEDGKTPLAVVQAHFSGGGPLRSPLPLYHDSGKRPALLADVHGRRRSCCS